MDGTLEDKLVDSGADVDNSSDTEHNPVLDQEVGFRGLERSKDGSEEEQEDDKPVDGVSLEPPEQRCDPHSRDEEAGGNVGEKGPPNQEEEHGDHRDE